MTEPVACGDTGESLEESVLPLTLEPRESDQFARAELEVDRRGVRNQSQVLRAERGVAERVVARRALELPGRAGHVRDELRDRQMAPVYARDRPPGSQHRDAIRDLLHLVHAVGDEQDADALGRETAHLREQTVAGLHVQCGRRLVEDEDPRLAHERADDADGLPIRERELSRRGVQVDARRRAGRACQRRSAVASTV